MKFINRQQELSRLDRLANSEEAAMAVIWGRRRVGKTRLLLEWAHKYQGIYYTADESAPAIQRKYFALALQQALPDFAAVEYSDWHSLFMRLAKEAMYTGWRGPLIIDELPYLISSSPELASVLQKFIDHEGKKAKMIVALSGSSQRMMQGAVLDASAPLFGRANEIIKLGPITAGYMAEGLNIKSSREVVETYSIWGGIPRYWELVNNNRGSFFENIDQLVLDPLGALNDEPNHLLLEEAAISLRPILDAIGLGAHRLSEIAARIGQPVTSFMRQIQRLLELDLIEREISFGSTEYNSKRTLYKIKDPFMRFWFEIVAPQRSYFTQISSAQRQAYLKNSFQHIFSVTWEDLSRAAVPRFPYQLSNIAFGRASRYWHKQDSEWDILANSVEGKALFIGEAKWIAKPPSAQWIYKTIEELKYKGLPPTARQSNKQVVYGLFIPEKPKDLDLPENIQVIDANEVLQVLR
ncbi:Uncharacterized protein DB41_KD00010 [Neochlamydia sp. TUME1]|uniref:ATP-binding protein n=1 Tax=Neochlamydia sp. TUME1 TaxID=1478174 RepID=UPI00057C7AEE|nr:ATP-binding protein [Neochlamydia sp. TUME1]KIC72701.1 Uncharacterized protein DB41_KD00010 [Neochlamydia sp. TUME1]